MRVVVCDKHDRIYRDRKGLISFKQLLSICMALTVVLFLLVVFLQEENQYVGVVRDRVVIEAGDSVELALFTDDVENIKTAYDINSIDTTLLGSYPIPFVYNNRRYMSLLEVRDTIPPTGTVQELITDYTVLPSPIDFVTSFYDVTPVTISYAVIPDVSVGGYFDGSISLKDIAGNETLLPIHLTVIDDYEPPKIYLKKEIKVYVGTKIKYREGVTVEDNMDPSPSLTIDNSGVDVSTPGTYEVYYTATDYTGNSRTMSVRVIVEDYPEGYVDEELVYSLAAAALNEITDDSMSEAEKCFKVYNWCKTRINYIGTSDKSHWTKGAYDGFTTLSGDCFTYAACAKAMFDVIGVENYVIERNDGINSTHFWNLLEINHKFYWADCSRTNTPMNAFLLTDQELDALNYVHGYRYHYDNTGLPMRSDESIQSQLNYYSLTVSGL